MPSQLGELSGVLVLEAAGDVDVGRRQILAAVHRSRFNVDAARSCPMSENERIAVVGLRQRELGIRADDEKRPLADDHDPASVAVMRLVPQTLGAA